MLGRQTRKKKLPKVIKPMVARLTRHPFDSPEHFFELKWDGIRGLAFVDGGRLRLQSRNMRDMAARFPELAELLSLVKDDRTVLDGELVCFDQEGHPSLQQMQRRLDLQAGKRSVQDHPAHFVAFDLLFHRGLPVTDEPLSHRKELLRDVLQPSELVQTAEFTETEGRAFFQATCEHGLEGIIAKEKASRYLPGKRDSSWLKVKRVRECDFVVAGYTFGGTRRGTFSSLLLGLYEVIEAKLGVAEPVVGAPAPAAGKVLDLMEALKASIEATKHDNGESPPKSSGKRSGSRRKKQAVAG